LRIIVLMLAALAPSMLGGCASVTRGWNEQVQINSQPEGAEVRTSLAQACVTPCTLTVSRKDEFSVSFAKPGYQPQTVQVATRIANAGAAGFAGNVLVGGLIGMGVDAASGATHIVNYVVVDDFGVTLNPLLLAGQVHGGAVQGIGQALMERTVYDAASGQLVTASLMDYPLPRAADSPSFAFETRNVPCATNPLGVKGAGEAGAIGSCPAVMNAIVDALWRAYRVRHVDMPATPERLWQAIEEAHRVHTL